MTRVIKRGVSLTEKDIEILKTIREKCGFVSDSEALRAIIRFFEQHAPCLKS